MDQGSSSYDVALQVISGKSNGSLMTRTVLELHTLEMVACSLRTSRNSKVVLSKLGKRVTDGSQPPTESKTLDSLQMRTPYVHEHVEKCENQAVDGRGRYMGMMRSTWSNSGATKGPSTRHWVRPLVILHWRGD